MKVVVTLVVDDEALVDAKDRTGLTEAAYNDLMEAVAGLGYSFDDVVKEED